MAYSNETSLAMPPTFRGIGGAAGQPKYYQPTKPQQYKRQHNRYPQPPPKSQPFDAEDLRRRLHIVIAEREAQSERRQRQRVDALPAKRAQVERERDMAATAATQFHLEDRSSDDMVMMTKTTSINRWSGSLSMSRSLSTREQQQKETKLRHRNSMMAAFPSSGDMGNTDASLGYRHVPEQAAAQFSRTTTSNGMRHQTNNNNGNNNSTTTNKKSLNSNDKKSSNNLKNIFHDTTSGPRDKSLVHALSRAALRLYTEGLSSAERNAIETSITPGKQRNVLKRSRDRKAEQQGRNQFQDPLSSSDYHHHVPLHRTTSTTWRRRHSRTDTILSSSEEEGVSGALADLHLHTYASQEEQRRSRRMSGAGGSGGGGGGGGENHSSEETLVDAATANEHRIDWTQSDEMMPRERRKSFPVTGGGMQLQQLLRKTTSILSLRKNSTGGGNNNNHHEGNEDKKNNVVVTQHHERPQRQQLRIVTIREEIDEQAEAEADDAETPMSPNSGRSGRFGIWGRLRRGSVF